jgi:hypothetical protein
MVLKPSLDIVDQAVLGADPKDIAPWYSIDAGSSDIRFKPAPHKLPGEFERELEMLDRAGSNGFARYRVQCCHESRILALGLDRSQGSKRVAKGVEYQWHALSFPMMPTARPRLLSKFITPP